MTIEQLHSAELICGVCGGRERFMAVCAGASLRETRCSGCGASRRVRDVAKVLVAHCLKKKEWDGTCLEHVLGRLRPLRILELQAKGALHDRLAGLPGYICSEYYAHIQPGQKNEAGVLCQDATGLTFADESFDLVISQDVLEHIHAVWQAFTEIRRVLSVNGAHIFTVPIHEGHKTRQRAAMDTDGTLTHLLSPVHHKDPLNPDGALVYWDFGDDLCGLLEEHGIDAHLAARVGLHPTADICRIEEGESYQRYLRHKAAGSHVRFFLYNSNVFIASRDAAGIHVG